jgi:hypothetical protein
MSPNDRPETSAQETTDEHEISFEMMLGALADCSNEELASITAAIDTLIKKREKAEKRAAIKQIKALSQKFDINLQEIHTQPRKYQQGKKPES